MRAIWQQIRREVDMVLYVYGIGGEQNRVGNISRTNSYIQNRPAKNEKWKRSSAVFYHISSTEILLYIMW